MRAATRQATLLFYILGISFRHNVPFWPNKPSLAPPHKTVRINKRPSIENMLGDNFPSPELDKIVGGSLITLNTFSVNYERDACAFASNSYLSIISLSSAQRRDVKISENFRQITALSFSKSGTHIAVAEKGPDARALILAFDTTFTKITSRTEIRTKEVGISCIAIDSDAARVVTVGQDAQPFCLLWDLTQPVPVVIGYYRLPCTPSQICLGPNCSYCLIAGNKMLKFLDTSLKFTGKPSVLKSVRANIARYADINYVAVGSSSGNEAFALSSDGCLFVIETGSIGFLRKGVRASRGILVSPYRLNRGEGTSVSVDPKLIVCGTRKGAIQALKRDGHYKIFGQFQSPDSEVIALGIAKHCIIAAYNDGLISFWRRKLNSQPSLTISSHHGPICDMTICPDDASVITCGSDGTIRRWKLEKGLFGRSSQEQIAQCKLCEPVNLSENVLTGIMCTCTRGKLVFAGGDDGQLHILDENLKLLHSVRDNTEAVMSVAAHPSQPMLVTGGGDGNIRIYDIKDNTVARATTKFMHVQPVVAIVFTEDKIISASSNGIRFASLPGCELISSVNLTEAVLSLTYMPRPNLILGGGFDKAVTLYCPDQGRVFRKYLLSNSSYPLCVCSHPTDLILAVAMSDGMVFVLDAVSGNIITNFKSLAGVITAIAFHEGDLLLATFGGFLMRWILPQQLKDSLRKQEPIMQILKMGAPEEDKQNENFVGVIPGSIMAGNKQLPGWAYQEVVVDPVEAAEKQEGDEEEEAKEQENANFEEPRQMPGQPNDNEMVDQIIRASFIMRRQNDKDEEPSQAAEASIIDTPKLLPKVVEKESHPVLETIPTEDEPPVRQEVKVEPSVVEVAEKLEMILKQAKELVDTAVDGDKEAEEAQKELKELLGSLVSKSDENEIANLKSAAVEIQKQVAAAEEQLKSLRSVAEELLKGLE